MAVEVRAADEFSTLSPIVYITVYCHTEDPEVEMTPDNLDTDETPEYLVKPRQWHVSDSPSQLISTVYISWKAGVCVACSTVN